MFQTNLNSGSAIQLEDQRRLPTAPYNPNQMQQFSNQKLVARDNKITGPKKSGGYQSVTPSDNSVLISPSNNYKTTIEAN